MSLAEFHLELNRIVEDLHRETGSKYADFVLRGRQLAKEAATVQMEEWFYQNPEALTNPH
jgi:hypothetical protein